MRKLDDIRGMVDSCPTRYPLTYRLLSDGEINLTVIEQAIVNDLLHPNMITLDDLLADQLRIDSQNESARLLAIELMAAPGIASAQRGVAFIQAMGRNSEPSHVFNDSLKSPYATVLPVVSGEYNA